MRVTKRAVGVPEGRTDLFNVSEFYQEVVDSNDATAVALGGGAGAPKVTPVRCVTKYRLVAGPQIQALQRLEVFQTLLSADARDFGEVLKGGGGDREKPVAIYRYRGILVPVTGNELSAQPSADQPAEPSVLQGPGAL
mmetsp:Transcript_100115/g.224341  ORF Transcript_100115/g.224341 Transcript_100115/m.224341 type:complete len:138 (-) Transcript_100115:42-455(-)